MPSKLFWMAFVFLFVDMAIVDMAIVDMESTDMEKLKNYLR